jgi:hypothetical protein
LSARDVEELLKGLLLLLLLPLLPHWIRLHSPALFNGDFSSFHRIVKLFLGGELWGSRPHIWASW